MFAAFEVLTTLLVALAMAPALAHALELPGKLRLGEQDYRTVQLIYYPGFTICGFAEVAAIAATLVLLVALPFGSAPFWLTALALVALVAMQAIFWTVTQPVNRHWVENLQLTGRAGRFFGTGRRGTSPAEDWTVLRDRWEASHVARAGASLIALAAAVTAIAL